MTQNKFLREIESNWALRELIRIESNLASIENKKSPDHAPADDNEETKKSETFAESKVGENGSSGDGHGGDLHVLLDVNGKGTEPSFKEIGNDDVHPDLENESYEQFTCGEAVLDFSPGLQPKELEIAKGELETELEDLFKQKIEAEVEYLTISRTVQKLTICAVDQNTIPVDQKLSAS
ncbi:WPP domain-interacting protein [Striga asiatica]|uniref:WPP domain-interacting protein n=1 Tax=Striga asiatica TaxID=4170 RepID=A0A5A7RIM1_STRAF|nr:WPP domain-interacting protein [Striga asiatica]